MSCKVTTDALLLLSLRFLTYGSSSSTAILVGSAPMNKFTLPATTTPALQVFNAAEMRIKGTDLEKFAKSKGRASGGGNRGRGAGNRRGGKAAQPRGFDDTPVGGAGGAKASKWRQQSKQFRDALRQVGWMLTLPLSPQQCYGAPFSSALPR